jgi:hypothetical protein
VPLPKAERAYGDLELPLVGEVKRLQRRAKLDEETGAHQQQDAQQRRKRGSSAVVVGPVKVTVLRFANEAVTRSAVYRARGVTGLKVHVHGRTTASGGSCRHLLRTHVQMSA